MFWIDCSNVLYCKSSQELLQKCPCIPKTNWNLELCAFKERGKLEYPKTSLRRVAVHRAQH